MAVSCLVSLTIIAIIFLLDPRTRLARAELAFNHFAWLARLDVVNAMDVSGGTIDLETRARVQSRLYAAISLLNAKDAAAFHPASNPGEDEPSAEE